ncbi:hypothetical protein [Pontibacter mangrovi]|uniref:Uncharacterized protein n=1 Tax=Pontibacter mangrovi TaxID=2589816 RepID=A0A501W8W5_9BACT|nr:hypothetical protein [Pontibacter mangrovi]TPE43247.1 hypothetical protein FJM65_14130 [Pontibacter mangrovi]
MRKWYKLYSNILYLHFSEAFLQLPESAKNAVSPKNPLLRLGKVAGYTFLRLIGNLFKSVKHEEKLQAKIWLYVVSQNNYDSLKFIAEELHDAVFVAGQSKEIGKYNRVVERLSLRRKLLYYYKFLPLLLQFLKYKTASTIRFFDVLFDAVGFYEVYLRKLQKYKPKAIVFANDHNADARAMLLAAKSMGIKTIYIQHASVSPMFPPLAYDLNLLEGQDALDKYKLCGPVTGQVELIGMPKADAFVPFRNQNKTIQTIGIGCNLMDDVAEIEKLLTQLTTALPSLSLILRPHPRDTRNFSKLQSISPQISLSDSRTVATFDYLRQIDVQVSGNSGIHLEAVLLNVWSMFYDFNPKHKLEDYYGFVKHGLVEAVSGPEELIGLLQTHLSNKPDVTGRAKYYNATVGTAYDGKSGTLALKQIAEFLKH